MMFSATDRLTDDLERRLIQQAFEEQFRPQPLRALKTWTRKLFKLVLDRLPSYPEMIPGL